LHSLTRFALALFVLAPASLANVLTVGPAGSGAQFTEIQAAVDAAQAGDVILVQPGTYGAITVFQKPLRILGDGTGTVTVAGAGFAAHVGGLLANEELVLSGLRLQSIGSLLPVVRVENSAGTVVLHDLELPLTGFGVPGLLVVDCPRVLVLDSLVRGGVLGGFGATPRGALYALRSGLWIAGCEIAGANGDHFVTQEGAHALEVSSCEVRLWSSRLFAGGSGMTLMGSGGQGGTGLLAVASRVELFGGPGSEILGGHGAFESTTSLNYAGGPAVSVRQGSSLLVQLAQTVEGGLDGLETVRAPSFDTDGTTSTRIDTLLYPTLACPPQAALGATITLTLAGNPGALQVAWLALRTGPTTILRRVAGAGVLDPFDYRVAGITVLSNAGSATLPLAVPPTSALLGTTVFLQGTEKLGQRYAIGNPALVAITR
jgi:hypothetical protein